MSRPNPFLTWRFPTAWSLIAVVLTTLFPISGYGQEGAAILAALEDGFTKIIENAEPSVVSIARIRQSPPHRLDDSGEFGPPQSEVEETFIPSEFGAGVIFEPPDQPGKRFILTMYHVVKGGHIAGQGRSSTDDLLIHTHDRRKAKVEILAADPRSDLAVLQIQRGESLTDSQLKPLRMAKNVRYKKGQLLLTLGNPYAIARDGSTCAGWGMLSNIARHPKPVGIDLSETEKRKQETLHHLGTLLQIDGQLNLGTSGGAVLNRQGELIGIVTAMAALEGYEKSVGYAVPLDQNMQRIVTELAHGYEVNYGLLGIWPKTKAFPPRPQPTAVWVEATGRFSPAERAGVRPQDMIYQINGTTIYTQEDLMREVALIGPGETAKLQLYRPLTRQWLTKEVTLTKWPVHNDEEIIATQHRYFWNNLAIDYSTARFDFFNQEYRPAVLVTHIARETPEQFSQLRVGDFITHVDDRPVTSPQEFEAAVKGKTSGTVKLGLSDRTIEVPVKE